MKKNGFYIVIVILSLSSCHPFYKRLTRGNWEKRTELIKFPDLPIIIKDTLIKYFEATFTKDTLDDISDEVSFDLKRQFTHVEYYDAYSNKLRLPFGLYFKIGKKKCFIYYSDLETPLIYYNGFLFFPSGEYFDVKIINNLYSKYERTPYDKKYYRKYKLK